jgi:hypothetical protein
MKHPTWMLREIDALRIRMIEKAKADPLVPVTATELVQVLKWLTDVALWLNHMDREG